MRALPAGAGRAAPADAAAALARVARAVPVTWRRSMQLRVVATTCLLGLVGVSLVGVYLAEEISKRLLDSRRDQVELAAEQAVAEFQDLMDSSEAATPADLQQTVGDALGRVGGSGGDADRGVLLLRAPANRQPRFINDVTSAGLAPSSIPEPLRAAVLESGQQRSRSIALPGPDGPVPGLAVGQLVTVPLAGEYELYVVVSLQREQLTVDAVQAALVVGGVVLVALVGAIAWVVTRQVVIPVRQAAAVAARLSAGHLEQRMPEHGEDDLALLARTFNEMALSLQQQIGQLEELSRLQRRFVADVSHELRTPLTTIRMAGEVIHEARHDFAPAVARSAELLADQLDRFEALLADLLEISRFDAGAAALDAEPVDLREVVGHVGDLMSPLAEGRGSSLRIHLPPSPCVAEVDPRRVERILRNLVANAIEHCEGQPVDVTLGADADTVAVLVRDHGTGLRPEDAARVFDRFWRADPARARTTGGSGLGLAISSEDARLHGGRLEATGRPGLGSAFRLTLPRLVGGPVVGSPLPLDVPRTTAGPAHA